MIRLFVALALPDNLRQRLKTLCNGVRDARWVEEKNLHLTLRYIGEVEEPELAYIMAALSSVQVERFDLTLSGVGHFESRGKIRSLWVGIQPCSALGALQQRIESVLTRHGIASDGRKFSPHITLARLTQCLKSLFNSTFDFFPTAQSKSLIEIPGICARIKGWGIDCRIRV